MISEISGEGLKLVNVVNTNTDLITRRKLYCYDTQKTYTSVETIDEELQIVIVKNGKEMPYLKTKHLSSIIDSIGYTDGSIGIAQRVIDLVYEQSVYFKEDGIARWTAEELTEFTIDTLEDFKTNNGYKIDDDSIEEYGNVHNREDEKYY